MSLIFDHLSIAYRFLAPHPFDERVFTAHLEEKFEGKKIKAFAIGPDGLSPVDDKILVYKESSLNFNPDMGIVGVAGSDYDEVSEAFSFVRETLSDKMGLDLGKAKFLEIISKGRYKPVQRPLKRMASAYSKELMTQISPIFGGNDITPMSIRVCSSNAIEEEVAFREIVSWHEFRIEPLLMNPTFYFWELIYRKGGEMDTLALWEDFPSKIQALLQAYDSEDGA